jgi:hypothetical protein
MNSEEDVIERQIKEAKELADAVIVSAHWGVEDTHLVSEDRIELANRMIRWGADVILGCHTHTAETMEWVERDDGSKGFVYYSMGNFIFGGSSFPSDQDTAIVQMKVERSADGTVSIAGYDIIPCCVSSLPVTDPNLSAAVRRPKIDYNDFRPTPYEEGSEDYNRALSKIDGSYTGPDGQADYSDWHSQHQ